ncbi:MAG: DUF1349 domain-containing protein [Pirellulaceae bacterium]|nr:DUF1349 domain-containing protein [Pirellulaceae bacterium]
MRLPTCLVIATLVFLTGRQIACAEETDGVVDKVQGSDISIKPEFHFIPDLGDKIEIFVKIPDVGEAKLGTAIVTGIDDERVHARVEKATGKIQPGQIVRALAVEPAAPPAEPSQQNFLVVKSPAAKVMAGTESVAQVKGGQRLPFTKQNGDWYLVQIQQSDKLVRGWIHSKDVIVEGTAPTADGNQAQEIPGWGTVVDPQGDCVVAAKADAVSITVPGTYHDLAPADGYDNMDAPRVLQDAQGDFILQVRARRFEQPEPNTGANAENPRSYVSSGLLVWQDRGNFIRFQRAASADSGFVGTFGQLISGGDMIGGSRIELADQDTYLRVERKAGKFNLAQSRDGKTWMTVQTQGKELTLQDKVKVGVFVINGTNRQITHEFADFRLTAD